MPAAAGGAGHTTSSPNDTVTSYSSLVECQVRSVPHCEVCCWIGRVRPPHWPHIPLLLLLPCPAEGGCGQTETDWERSPSLLLPCLHRLAAAAAAGKGRRTRRHAATLPPRKQQRRTSWTLTLTLALALTLVPSCWTGDAGRSLLQPPLPLPACLRCPPCSKDSRGPRPLGPPAGRGTGATGGRLWSRLQRRPTMKAQQRQQPTEERAPAVDPRRRGQLRTPKMPSRILPAALGP